MDKLQLALEYQQHHDILDDLSLSEIWEDYLSEKNEKPMRFEVVSKVKGGHTHKFTNDPDTAVKYYTQMDIKYGNAEAYEQMRYVAKLRLYHYLNRKVNE